MLLEPPTSLVIMETYRDFRSMHFQKNWNVLRTSRLCMHMKCLGTRVNTVVHLDLNQGEHNLWNHKYNPISSFSLNILSLVSHSLSPISFLLLLIIHDICANNHQNVLMHMCIHHTLWLLVTSFLLVGNKWFSKPNIYPFSSSMVISLFVVHNICLLLTILR